MDKGFYQLYYDFERSHWWFLARAEILKTYIHSNIYNGYPLKILNVGSATGASSEWLSEFGEVSSIEYNEGCINFLSGKGFKLPVEQGSILNLPYGKNTFDLVCGFDVIEHVEDDKSAVNEMIRVCNNGGVVLTTVPAYMNLWSQHDEINHHYRRYIQGQLCELFKLSKCGHIVFSSYFNSRLYYPIFIARKISNLFVRVGFIRKLKSDMETFKLSLLNKIFYKILEGEKLDLSFQKKRTKGVSILLHWKKSIGDNQNEV